MVSLASGGCASKRGNSWVKVYLEDRRDVNHLDGWMMDAGMNQ